MTANWWQRPSLRGAALLVTEAGRRGAAARLWKTAPYYAAELLGKLHKRVLATAIEQAPAFQPQALTGQWTAEGEASPWWNARALPLVTAVATLSDDGQELVLLVLNKKTTEAFDVRVELDGFVPRAAFTKAVLDTVAPSGHGGIFQINPWRRSTNDRCVPDDGGCSRTLAPEAHENVTLAATVERGARAAFSVTVPAHSATLVTLTRAESDADLQEQTHDLNPN